MDFAKFSGTNANGNTSNAPTIPQNVTDFVAQLGEAGFRMSYQAWHKLLVAAEVLADESTVKDSYPYLDSLPIAIQFAVCRSTGYYAKGVFFAIQKEVGKAKMAEISKMEVYGPDQIVAAFEEFLSEQV